MLFMVQMDVQIPHDISSDAVAELKKAERAQVQELLRRGIWRHLWRIVGRYANFSVIDAPSNADLHDILSSLPLFPFMKITVTPLCRHPSSIRDDDH
jgi:muconolactone D-isomerase